MQKRPFVESKYDQLEEIGAGALGSVTQYISRSSGKELCALKAVKEYKKSPGFHIYSRLNILADLKSDLVSRVISYEVEKKTFQILFEYAEGYPLSEIIGQNSIFNKRRLGVMDRLKVLNGTALALKFLHENKQTHLDLKLGNIIFNPNKGIPVLTHAGICGILGINVAKLHANDKKLNPSDLLFIAPELNSGAGDISSDKNNFCPVDIYSFGVLMCEVIGDDTFEGRSSVLVPQFLGENEKNFINKCLSKKPDDRPKIEEVCCFLMNSSSKLFISGKIELKGEFNEAEFKQFLVYITVDKKPSPQNPVPQHKVATPQPTKSPEILAPIKISHKKSETHVGPIPGLDHPSQNAGASKENTAQAPSLGGKKTFNDRINEFQQNHRPSVDALRPPDMNESKNKAAENENDPTKYSFTTRPQKDSNTGSRKSMYDNNNEIRKNMDFLSRIPAEDENSLRESFKKVLAQEKEAKMTNPGEQENIIKLYKEIADKGYQFAQVKYAMLIYQKKDLEAEKYYKYAIEQGNSDALNNMGCIEEKKKNIKNAMEHYKKSADKGNPHGLNNYGRMLEMEHNTSEAMEYYKKAADLNDSDGIANWARLKEDDAISKAMGEGDSSSDIEKVRELYSKSESKMAQNNLGLIKLDLLGTITSVPNYRFKSSTMASSTASNSSTSDNNEYKEGINHLLKAAALGSKEAQFNLAYINNDVDAYRKLAEDDNEPNRSLITPAINNFAVERYAQSQFAAFAQFKKAADQNNPYAINNYGVMLLNGVGVDGKKQEAEAFHQFEIAKGQYELPEAIYNLAFCYDHGICVTTKKKYANDLYQDAIDKSHGKNIRAMRAMRASNA